MTTSAVVHMRHTGLLPTKAALHISLIVILSVLSVRAMAQVASLPGLDPITPIKSQDAVADNPAMAPSKPMYASEEFREEQEPKSQLYLNNSSLGLNQNTLSVETLPDRQNGSGIAFEVSGGYSNNIYNLATDKVSSPFARYGAPLSLDRARQHWRFHLFYDPELTHYSATTQNLYQSHTYSHLLTYGWSDKTTIIWQFAAAHYQDVGQFLPSVLPTGGIGIAQPPGSNHNAEGASTVSKIATAIGVLHRLSDHDRITYTGTASWDELAQTSSLQGGMKDILRSQPYAGDVLYEHTLNTTVSLGLDGTVAYVRELSNSSGLLYGTFLGTLHLTPDPSNQFLFSAGPLLRHGSGSTGAVSDDDPTYAFNAGYTHRSALLTIHGGYARVIQLNLNNSASVGNQIFGNIVMPLSRALEVSMDLRYIRASLRATTFRETDLGGSVRVDYRRSARLGWFATASPFHVSQPWTSTATSSFGRYEISGGLRFSLTAVPAGESR